MAATPPVRLSPSGPPIAPPGARIEIARASAKTSDGIAEVKLSQSIFPTFTPFVAGVTPTMGDSLEVTLPDCQVGDVIEIDGIFSFYNTDSGATNYYRLEAAQGGGVVFAEVPDSTTLGPGAVGTDTISVALSAQLTIATAGDCRIRAAGALSSAAAPGGITMATNIAAPNPDRGGRFRAALYRTIT